MPLDSYIDNMKTVKSPRVPFHGTVVRTEPDGFVVIHFDKPIGPMANTHAIISTSTGTSTSADTAFKIINLRPQERVSGFATTDNQHHLPKIVELYVSNQKLVP